MSKHSLEAVLRYVRRIAGPGEADDAVLLEQFARQGDEAAFQKLVAIHGPMVFALCRRLLRHEQDAEDAFQATFLTPARKAGKIRKTESLASWLYKVAFRVACRVRNFVPEQTNRMAVLDRPAPEKDAELIWRDLRIVLDEEIARLPERYRRPIVLCYLQGKTNEEAARLLGCPNGTVATRLARGREQLRRRLTRRGCALSTGLLASVLATKACALPLPIGLLRSTMAYASLKITAFLSGKVLALSDGALRMFYLNKMMKMATAVVLALVMAGTGAGLVARHSWAGAAPKDEAAGAAKPEPAKAARIEDDKDAKQGDRDRVDGMDLYGDPLPEGAVARFGTVRFRHGLPLTASAISPDGRLLGGGTRYGIQIWDAESGKILQRIPVPDARFDIAALAFSSDNKLLAGFGTKFGPRLFVCDVATGKILKQFDVKPDSRGEPKYFDMILPGKVGAPKTGRTPYLAFLPGANMLLFTDSGPTVRMFDVTSGSELRAFLTSSPTPPSIAIAPDGQKVAVMDDDLTVRLWEASTGKELLAIAKHKFTPPNKGNSVTAKEGVKIRSGHLLQPVKLAFAPDGKTLATGNRDGIFLWDVATGKLQFSLDAPDAKDLFFLIRSLSFASDGKSLVSGSKAMVIWDPSTGKEIRRLDYPDGSAFSTVFLPHSNILLLSTGVKSYNMPGMFNQDTFSFVDATTGKPCRLIDGHHKPVKDIVYSPDGLYVATTAEEGTWGRIRGLGNALGPARPGNR